MMVHTNNLIPCDIDNVRISFLGIHQYHFVLVAEHALEFIYIEKLDAYNLDKLPCAVTVNLSLVTNC
jgi:hypothetical protein